MPRSLEAIVGELNAITCEELEARGMFLHEICEDVLSLPVPGAAFPEFFGLMERLPEADLGSPGPLVHTMEQYVGSYEELLVESVSRKPTLYTVWMVNRILNGPTRDRSRWMEMLRVAAEHPAAAPEEREEARNFMARQERRGGSRPGGMA